MLKVVRVVAMLMQKMDVFGCTLFGINWWGRPASMSTAPPTRAANGPSSAKRSALSVGLKTPIVGKSIVHTKSYERKEGILVNKTIKQKPLMIFSYTQN